MSDNHSQHVSGALRCLWHIALFKKPGRPVYTRQPIHATWYIPVHPWTRTQIARKRAIHSPQPTGMGWIWYLKLNTLIYRRCLDDFFIVSIKLQNCDGASQQVINISLVKPSKTFSREFAGHNSTKHVPHTAICQDTQWVHVLLVCQFTQLELVHAYAYLQHAANMQACARPHTANTCSMQPIHP